jgi:hypothetical protein
MANIIEFNAPTKANPYTETVADLIAAGEGKACEVIVKAGDEGKERTKFSKAANDAGKTARLRISEDIDGGQHRMVFTLTTKHAQRRGKAVESSVSETEAPKPTPKASTKH